MIDGMDAKMLDIFTFNQMGVSKPCSGFTHLLQEIYKLETYYILNV